MGKHAKIALDEKFKAWGKRFKGLNKDINPFEYFCIDQFLRPFALGDKDLQSGMIGGHKNGGVDALYFFVNRDLVAEDSELNPETAQTAEIIIMQIKEGEGFSPVAIDKLNWFCDDLLALNRPKKDYHYGYKEDLIALMRVFKDKYRVVISGDPKVTINCYYITRLDDIKPNEDCVRSENALKKTIAEYMPKAICNFVYVDAERLWYQTETKPKKSRGLTWAQPPLPTPEGHIGLVRLADYYAFLQDSDGELSERIFDSNVRGYWPKSDVNKEIGDSLRDAKTEFWLLNNGITILAEKADSEYPTSEITDPQVVNGLQTSRQIFSHFQNPSEPKPVLDNRRLLVRVIKTADKAIRDAVINCTNNQNKMPDESLRVTDPIHRQLEDIFSIRRSCFMTGARDTIKTWEKTSPKL